MGLRESKGNMYNHKLPDIEYLKCLYYDKKLSGTDIAKKYNVTPGAVFIKFRRYGIKRRSLSDAQALKANHIELSSGMIEFIDGLLLGDGCVSCPTQSKKSACYSHTDKHVKYLTWLAMKLLKYNIITGTIAPHFNNTFHLKTKFYREFLKIRIRWYPDGKKKVPLDIKITPIVLLNWYIGDGSFRSGKNERVILCMMYDEKGHDLPEPTWPEIEALVTGLEKFTTIREKHNLGRIQNAT